MLGVQSPLDDRTERLVSRVIGCCIAVHRELGPGMSERVYAEACAVELRLSGIECEREKPLAVRYRDHLLCYQRVDLFVAGTLVLETKSVDRLHPVHVAQVVTYLRLTGVRAGLLVNFNVEVLKHGIRRVVL